MSFNFSGQNNEINESADDNSKPKNIFENLLDKMSPEEIESKMKLFSNQLNVPIFTDQTIPENPKIYEITTNYNKEGENLENKINDINQNTGNFTKKTEVVEKHTTTDGNNKTVTTTTTTTIIKNKPKIITTTENIRYIINDNDNNNDNNNINNNYIVKNKINMLPTL